MKLFAHKEAPLVRDLRSNTKHHCYMDKPFESIGPSSELFRLERPLQTNLIPNVQHGG